MPKNKRNNNTGNKKKNQNKYCIDCGCNITNSTYNRCDECEKDSWRRKDCWNPTTNQLQVYPYYPSSWR